LHSFRSDFHLFSLAHTISSFFTALFDSADFPVKTAGTILAGPSADPRIPPRLDARALISIEAFTGLGRPGFNPGASSASKILLTAGADFSMVSWENIPLNDGNGSMAEGTFINAQVLLHFNGDIEIRCGAAVLPPDS
jgi:hypothetical protein